MFLLHCFRVDRALRFRAQLQPSAIKPLPLLALGLGIQFPDDAVGQPDGRDIDKVGMDAIGDNQEYLGRRHYDIRAVGLQAETIHPFLDGKRLQFVVQGTQRIYRKNQFFLVFFLRQTEKLVDVATATYYINRAVVDVHPFHVGFQTIHYAVLHGSVEQADGSNVVAHRPYQLALVD